MKVQIVNPVLSASDQEIKDRYIELQERFQERKLAKTTGIYIVIKLI